MANAMALANKRTIRARINPMDICTIISILPKLIRVENPTIQPGEFIIPAGTYEKPSLLHVGPSSWWKETGENEPLLEISEGSVIVASAVTKDWCNGILGCNMGDMIPGFFFIPGRIELLELLNKPENRELLDAANERQNRWLDHLIHIADVLWATSNGNPKAISEDMRLAANLRGVKNQKPWMNNYVAAELIPCVACGNLRNPLYPVCQTCNTIVDKTKYETLGLTPLAKA